MTTYLRDVNVLIALVDPAHVQHESAHHWFGEVQPVALATCPITKNGLLRIVGQPKYPDSPAPPSLVAAVLRAMRALPGHTFWPDSLSLVGGSPVLYVAHLSSHSRVSESCLLALAQANNGRLTTLDARPGTVALPAEGPFGPHLSRMDA